MLLEQRADGLHRNRCRDLTLDVSAHAIR